MTIHNIHIHANFSESMSTLHVFLRLMSQWQLLMLCLNIWFVLLHPSATEMAVKALREILIQEGFLHSSTKRQIYLSEKPILHRAQSKSVSVYTIPTKACLKFGYVKPLCRLNISLVLT